MASKYDFFSRHFDVYPFEVVITFSPKAFKRELKLRGLPNHPFLHTDTSCATTTEFNYDDGRMIIFITFDKKHFYKITNAERAGIIAHEAQHVLQSAQNRYANADRLGVEADAYLVQRLVVDMTGHWDEVCNGA